MIEAANNETSMDKDKTAATADKMVDNVDLQEADKANESIESSGVEKKDEQAEIKSTLVKSSTALKLLANYNSESSDDDDADEKVDNSAIFECAIKTMPGNYREQIQDISDSDDDRAILEGMIKQKEGSSESSDCLTVSSGSSSDEEEDNGAKSDKVKPDKKEKKTAAKAPRVKGEMTLDDLPPIQDLHISVPEYECLEFGRVESIVDQLVIVKSHPNSPYLDLDSVLFLHKGQSVLGEVFDVLGQVSSPLYCVRFNSNEHIKERNITVGELVYSAPRTRYTQMMVLSKLINSRGSDASWMDDIEPPPQFLDYSDDEEEAIARKNLRQSNDNANAEEEATNTIVEGNNYGNTPRPRAPSFQMRQSSFNNRRQPTPGYRMTRPPYPPSFNQPPSQHPSPHQIPNQMPFPMRSPWYSYNHQ